MADRILTRDERKVYYYEQAFHKLENNAKKPRKHKHRQVNANVESKQFKLR